MTSPSPTCSPIRRRVSHTAKVLDLVLAVPKYGRVKANKLLERCRVSSSKTVNGLTPRQRKELLDMLGA